MNRQKNNKESITAFFPQWESPSPLTSPTVIIVLGASGDLAKKKTYPCLFQLYKQHILIPSSLSNTGVIIYGFGRTQLSNEEFRQKIRPFLSGCHNKVNTCHENNQNNSNTPEYHAAAAVKEEDDPNDVVVTNFLSMCFYQAGQGYNDVKAFLSIRDSILQTKQEDNLDLLFYMATPPNIFAIATKTIVQAFRYRNRSSGGFIRVLYEKPFGSDVTSYQQLSDSLSSLLEERQMFRIDHYLGKDMVRQIPIFRFGDSPLRMAIMNNNPHYFWSRRYISKVVITLKEIAGTDGRGGYFDQYGIIRDVIQNHLLQIMCLVAMEEPTGSSNKQEQRRHDTTMDEMRDAKCDLLRHVQPPTLKDCVVGQYMGYRNEPMVKEDSKTPTFAVIRLFIDNDRWRGVPFILMAGKGLDEQSLEVEAIVCKIGLSGIEQQQQSKEQKLTIQIQPKQYVCFHTNEHSTPEEEKNGTMQQSKMIWNYKRHEKLACPGNDDAYTKLIYDALQGRSSSFVRDDELRLSWNIFTPLLHDLEKVETYPYEFGSKGPLQAHKILDLNAVQNLRQSKL